MGLDHAMGVRESELPWIDIGVRTGYKQRYQGFFDKSRGLGARLGSLYAEPQYDAPRHKHTFQQVRYVVSGVLRYGREEYKPGDCLYIPEGASYGPAKPMTTKIDDPFQVHFVDIQFMGPSGIPYPEPDDVVNAQRELAKTGKFDDGIYVFPDGHKRDAYEAILEKLTGEPIKYPPSRLKDYVVMRSAAYPSIAHPSLAGISQKHLGYFFESGPNIKLLSIKAGTTLPAGKPQGHRALFLLSGEASLGNEKFPGISFIMLPDAVEHAAIRAAKDTELLVVGWTAPGKPLSFELF